MDGEERGERGWTDGRISFLSYLLSLAIRINAVKIDRIKVIPFNTNLISNSTGQILVDLISWIFY